MAYDKVVDSAALDTQLTAIANAIRAKTGGTAALTLDEMATAISDIQSGGGATEPYVEETFEDELSLTITSAKLFGYKSVRKFAFANSDILVNVCLNDGIKRIGNQAFTNCKKLDINSFPKTVELIMDMAFYGCQSISNLTFTMPIIDLRSMAFYGCSSLATVNFESTKARIDSNAFGNCNKLTTINVPWAEGAVANAPWGATKATINYNYTGE